MKLDPSQPSAPALCEFNFAKGGINSITVNPESGEVFFYSEKDKKIHTLSSECNEAGEFTETSTIAVTPKRIYVTGLAFDPVGKFAPDRPPGVLYAGAPSGEGGKEEKNEKGETLAESSIGYIFSRPVEAPPVVVSESASHVTATTALLRAQINPKGSETRYVFQYLTEAEYEANEPTERFAGAGEAPLGGAVLGVGSQVLPAAAALTGLSPDTAYRFRVVATSNCSVDEPEKVCEASGSAQAFRTFPQEAPGLPDERAWELVSPADKHGGQVFVADFSVDSCGLVEECKPGTQYAHPMQSAPDGEAIAYMGGPFSHTEGAVEENEYVSRRTASGWQTTSLTPLLLNTGSGYRAFDAGLTTGIMEQSIPPALSPEAPSGYPNVYAQPTANPLGLTPLLGQEPPNRTPVQLRISFAGASADFSRLFFSANDALTGETPFAPEALDGGPTKDNLYESAAGQLRLVNVLPGNTETQPGALLASVSGASNVLNGAVSAHPISADGSRVFWRNEAGQIYVREDAETTRAIPGPGKFLVASVDGSKVLLSSGLLYDLGSEASTDLTGGKGGFQGVVGQSDDLSQIYFVDTAVLDEAPNGQGAKAQEGKFNLYAWQGGSARYVATLAAQDNILAHDWESVPADRTAEASPHGRYVAFLSHAPITGYDNTGPCEPSFGAFTQSSCSEAFLYDSATDELLCASCNPSGTRPLGPTNLRRIYLGGPLPQPHYLSDEGRLLFDSQDSLSPFDTNEGTVPGHAVEDVYQYEPNGVGSCKRAAGCISLISAGHEAADSNFVSMDEDGKNVFFTTRDQLVLKDKDDLIDLYVAREDGGIPAETEVSRGECQGEACQPLVSPPNDPTPGSSSYEGAGNVDEKKAQKKKHKKKKKHAKKKSAHKRAAKHNRGGSK